MIEPPRWSESQLDADSKKSKQLFRKARLEEPIEAYSSHFEDYWGKVDELLEMTVDLTDTSDVIATRVLSDQDLRAAFRYVPGPPISEDDLETLVDCGPVNARSLARDPGLASRVAETVMSCLDRGRFPWVIANREATEAERAAAVVASAALMANQRIQTDRRNEGKDAQEQLVHDLLISLGFKEVKRRRVSTIGEAPAPKEFCGEAILGGRKADFIVGNPDRRILAIECKVSNSTVNSVKRLNNDAAVKASTWLDVLGRNNVVPIAVLSGAFKLQNLVDAQQRGLTLVWAHSLKALGDWIASCAAASRR